MRAAQAEMAEDEDPTKIHGWKDHPRLDELRTLCAAEPPIGMVEATLTDRAWGSKGNLLLYFLTGDGKGFKLSVWWDKGYKPKLKGPSFRDAPIGARYRLEIGTTQRSTLQLMQAALLDGEMPKTKRRPSPYQLWSQEVVRLLAEGGIHRKPVPKVWGQYYAHNYTPKDAAEMFTEFDEISRL